MYPEHVPHPYAWCLKNEIPDRIDSNAAWSRLIYPRGRHRSCAKKERIHARAQGRFPHYMEPSLVSQSHHGLYACSAPSRDHGRQQCSEAERQHRQREHDWVPWRNAEQLIAH